VDWSDAEVYDLDGDSISCLTDEDTSGSEAFNWDVALSIDLDKEPTREIAQDPYQTQSGRFESNVSVSAENGLARARYADSAEGQFPKFGISSNFGSSVTQSGSIADTDQLLQENAVDVALDSSGDFAVCMDVDNDAACEWIVDFDNIESMLSFQMNNGTPTPVDSPYAMLPLASPASAAKSLSGSPRLSNTPRRRLQNESFRSTKEEKATEAKLKMAAERLLGSNTGDEEDFRVGAEKELTNFLQRLAAETTNGEGPDALPQMEVRFQNLSVTVQQPKSQGIQTVFSFFKDALTSCFSQKEEAVLLNDLSGIIRPGRLTLLLGPPGSGRSTFLKTLGDKMHGAGVSVKGDITYNGEAADTDKFVLERAVAYVAQQDDHVAALTVLETLQMAYQCLNEPPPPVPDDEECPPVDVPEPVAEEEAIRITVSEESPAPTSPSPSPDQPLKSPDNNSFLSSQNGSIPAYSPQGGGNTRWMRNTANSFNDAGSEIGRVGTGNSDPTGHKPYYGSMAGSIEQSPASSVPSTGSKPSAEQAVTKVDILLEVLGLQSCKDIVLGNELIRGASGGQRKRVTLGEMLAGNFVTLFLDEITTGLDAAAALDIVKILRHMAHILKLSCVVALLQPGPEVFAQFDDVILLDGGNIVYHGERGKILSYFESLGFRCPLRKDVADYLQEVTTKAGEEYVLSEIELANKGISRPRSTQDFVTCWKQSSQAKAMQSALAQPAQEHPGMALSRFQSEFARPFLQSVAVCSRVFLKLLLRDPAAMRSQLVGNLVVGGIVGLVFMDLSMEQVQSKLGVIFLTMTNLGFIGLSTMPDGFALRGVFYKQRDANFYPTFAYGLAQSLVNLPVSLANVLIFSSIVYWLAGLTRDANGMHFVYFMGICLLLDLSMGQFFKLLIALMPSYDAATPVAAVSVLFMVIFCGFIFAPEEIPVYWLWAYYINPFTYAFTALVHNELKSESYIEIDLRTGLPLGEAYLEQFGFMTEGHWVVTACIFLSGFYILMLLLNNYFLHNIRHGENLRGPIAMRPDVFHASEPATPQTPQAVTFEGVANAGGSPRRGLSRSSSCVDFNEVTLAWLNLSYAVDTPAERGKKSRRLNLLNSISGYCLPGTMTALMGESGAGKTTLLDVLAGRKTAGYATGDIFVNGYPMERETFGRLSAYVEQTDIHSPTATITEALQFSARLRLPAHVGARQIAEFVSQTLKVLELKDDADRLVGGLSVEKAKRVTIGVELIANPSVVFLDEPTSGLDSRAAMLMMKVIRRLANFGRTVICTIHQPSVSIFESFDCLHLLELSGRTVFLGELGEESINLIEYFESIPGTIPIQAGANPSEWMLDVIGAGTWGGSPRSSPASSPRNFSAVASWRSNSKRTASKGASGTMSSNGMSMAASRSHNSWRGSPRGSLCGSFADWYESSNLYLDAEAKLAEEGVTKPGPVPKVEFEGYLAASASTQLKECLRKTFRSYWRNPSYNAVRLIVSVSVAILFGSIYWQYEPDDFATANSIAAVLYITTAGMGIACTMGVLPVMGTERVVFYRERASNMYHATIYGVAIGLVEVLYISVICFLFMNIFYWSVGLKGDVTAYLYYYVFFQLYVTQAIFFGQLLVCVLPNQQVAQIAAAVSSNIFSLFAGYMQPPQDIPVGLVVFHWVNPLAFAYKGLLLTQFHEDNRQIVLVVDARIESMSMSQFIFHQRFDDMHYDERFLALGVLVGFVVIAHLGTLCALKYINHLKR